MLILTEKPSVAQAFAAALGVPRKDGFWENAEYCIVSALGHLLEDFRPEDYDPRYAKWKLEDLPIIPDRIRFKPIEKTKKQLDLVKQCFDTHRDDQLLLATDAEREGEVIGAEILDYAGFNDYSRARRFWVSEALTREVILAGIKNAKPLAEYASYKEQGFARQRADWLVGMNISRLVALGSGALNIAAGRVQTAVLAAVYQREKEIASFSKEKYFEAAARLQAESPFTVKLLNPDNKEFPHRFAENSPLVSAALEKITVPSDANITSLAKEKKTVPPPQLYNLTALQKDAHKRFSYTPEETLAAAQALYEKHKCQSYPRTPSRVMGDGNVELVKSVFDKLKPLYGEQAQGADSQAVHGGNKRVFNSSELADHHALIPLAPLPDEASEPERGVFMLVVNRFFTVFKPDYTYNAVKLTADISGFAFAGTGVELIQAGWKGGARDDDEEKTENYAGIEEGKTYPVLSVSSEEKFTEPKKHYTYASLLSLMENPRGEDGVHLAGLGTAATRGAILKKLADRKYTELKGKSIVITDDGKFLVEALLKNDTLRPLASIPETTRWEETLRQDPRKLVADIETFVRNAVANAAFDRAAPEKESLGKCPLCAQEVFEGKKNYYCSGYKNDPPCRFVIWKEISGAAVSATDAKLMLLGQKTKMKKGSSRAGKPFEASFYLQGPEVKFLFKQDR